MPFDPAIPVLGIYWEEFKAGTQNRCLYSNVYCSISTIDKRWKQHKCWMMDEQKQNVEDSPYNEIVFYHTHKKRVEYWWQKKKRVAGDEMVRYRHWLNGHESEWTLGDSEGQGSLACYSPWGHRVGHNLVTEQQIDTPCNPDEPRKHYAKWKTDMKGYLLDNSVYITCPE